MYVKVFNSVRLPVNKTGRITKLIHENFKEVTFDGESKVYNITMVNCIGTLESARCIAIGSPRLKVKIFFKKHAFCTQ